MKIAISGSTGYVAQKLMRQLQSSGIEYVALPREYLYGYSDKLYEILRECDGVIHLAGAPILQRWTQRNKRIIYNSRVLSTQHLVSVIEKLPEIQRSSFFLSASAIGIYKAGQTHDESSIDFDEGFAGVLSREWEKASSQLPVSVRRIVFRIGPVVGSDSKMVRTMLPAFRLGLGGKIGNGKQAFPFIHIDDLVAAILLACRNEEFVGIYNLVAPERINNSQFTQAMASQIYRKARLSIPAFALKLFWGEAASMMIQSPEVIPARLQKHGFQFSRPTIREALGDIT